MFNRELRVGWVKRMRQEPPQADEVEDLTEKVAVMSEFAERIIKKVAMAALCYVLVDTGRQVVIARSIKH
jgi:hypothetical protein